MTKKEIGFSLDDVDGSTVLVKGVANGKGSKRSKLKREKRYSKVSLHLFEKEYIEKLYGMELELVKSQKSAMEAIREMLEQTAKVLMK